MLKIEQSLKVCIYMILNKCIAMNFYYKTILREMLYISVYYMRQISYTVLTLEVLIWTNPCKHLMLFV